MWVKQGDLHVGDLIDVGDHAARVVELPRLFREWPGSDWLKLDSGECVWSPSWFVIERVEED